MHIDKKLMHRIFGLIAGTIVFAWLVLDTARATVLFNRIWELLAPFAPVRSSPSSSMFPCGPLKTNWKVFTN